MVVVIASQRRTSKTKLASKVVLVAAAATALWTASSIASTSALGIHPYKVEGDALLLARHGDHEHSDVVMESSEMGHVAHDSSNATFPSEVESLLKDHSSHHHAHMSSAYNAVPDPSQVIDKATFIPIPPRPKGAGGHSHGGHGEPKMDLNETVILRSKGPDPLSYIEWDFAYGIGTSDKLLLFASAEDESSPMMGVGENRWRTLSDEQDGSVRMSIAADIKNRVERDSENPGRHRSLLLFHVVGCIVSCFVLLPLGECYELVSEEVW
jgi:acyl-CoA synthetase (AMP-forming)/AMP-acid ligase II